MNDRMPVPRHDRWRAIGEKLKKAREEKGWKQKDIVNLFFEQYQYRIADERTYRRWENGERNGTIPSKAVEILCELFNKTTEELGLVQVSGTVPTNLTSSPQKTLSSEPLLPTLEYAGNLSQTNAIEEENTTLVVKENNLMDEEHSSDTGDSLLTKQRLSRRKLFAIAGFSLASLGIGAFIAKQGISSTSQDLTTSFSAIPVGATIYIYTQTSEVEATTWSPSLQPLRIACASTDNNIYVFDALTGKHSFIYSKHHKAALGIAWSPDGKFLASASSDATVQVWNTSTGSLIFLYTGHQKDVHDVDWSPDGKFLASASSDATVQVWSPTISGQPLIYRHNASVISAKWSHDGKRIVSGSLDGVIHVWNVQSKEQLLNLLTPSGVLTVAWSPDGRYIASTVNHFTYDVDIWDSQTGTKVYTYNQHDNIVRRIAWSPDGRRLASASFDKTVHVWDALSGEHSYVYKHHKHWVVGLSWSLDGNYIASGSYDKTVRVWKV